jgi:putative tricarboxylic transport membrane protein
VTGRAGSGTPTGWRTDRVAGLALGVFGLAVAGASLRYPLGTLRAPGPALFPLGLALILAALGAWTATAGRASPPLGALGWAEWRHAAAILGACAGAALLLEPLGYRVTVAADLVVLLRGVERRGWALTAAVALGLALGSFYLFDTLLRVPLPRGPLGL